MANDLNSGLIGLTLLGGSAPASVSAASAGTVLTKAARVAKAQFTLPVVAPPWKASGGVPESVSAIQRLKSIVDAVQSSASLPPDLQTAFSAYKALDRLRVLAEYATRSTTSAAERAQLQSSFARGIAELQRYLAVAPSDRLTISFGQPRSRADSLALPPVNPVEVSGQAVGSDRYAAIPGLTGSETLLLRLSRPGASDIVRVDLSQGPQPATLDSVAGALNAAIAGIVQRGPDGTPLLDAAGEPRRQWDTAFTVVKGDKGWGLRLDTMGIEQVALTQEGAGGGLLVAASQSASGAPAGVALTRFTLPDSALRRATIGTLSAIDPTATAEQQLLPPKPAPKDGKAADSAPVPAALSASAMVSDGQGFSYVLGTTSGDSGTQRGDGKDDLLLSKVDAEGTILWQRMLGSGGASDGRALALAPNGDVVVAGTVSGDLDGASTDGDLLMMRFSPAGEEKFAIPVRAAGSDRGTAVAVAADGSVLVGGKAADGSATLARLDPAGRLLERQSLGPASEVRALAAAPDGSTLVLTGGADGARLARLDPATLTVSASVALDGLDATSLAVADDGRISVGGSIAGAPRNGRVIQLGADLSTTASGSLSGSGDVRVDSLAWLGNQLYAGGRTSGALGAPLAGTVDGFVAPVAADGSIGNVQQWGRPGTETGPVILSSAAAIDSATTALGFRPGLLNPPDSTTLVDRTSLRPGDRFSFRVDGGAAQTVTINAQDTLASLAERMGRLAGRSVTVRVAHDGDNLLLRIEAKAGHAIDLSAGPEGRDALAKLGLDPGRLVAPPPFDAKAPRVAPGGNYGLDLPDGLSIRDAALAAASLTRLKSAISTTQTAYRSLYWDSNKEALVNGGSKGGGTVSAYQSAQLARYKDALARLGGALTTSQG